MRFIPFAISIISVTLAESPVVPPVASAAVYSLTEWGCKPNSAKVPLCTYYRPKEGKISDLETVAIAQKCMEHASEYGCAARITVTAKFDERSMEPAISPTRTLYAATIPMEQRLVKGKIDGLKETLKKFVLTPPAEDAPNKLKGFNKLHLSAGVYFPVDLYTNIPHVYNSTKVEPEVESDKDKSVTWTDPKGDDLSGLGRNNLTIGVFVSTAEEATAKMIEFRPTLIIEYSLEKIEPQPPVFKYGDYELTGEHDRESLPEVCKRYSIQADPSTVHKCLKKFAAKSKDVSITVRYRGKRAEPVEPASNGTHTFFGMILLDSSRVHKEDLVGFTESVTEFVLYPEEEDERLADESLTKFTSLTVSIGKYHPRRLFEPLIIECTNSTKQTSSSIAWDLTSSPSSSPCSSPSSSVDMWNLTGDLVIGVLMPKAMAESFPSLKTFVPTFSLLYSLKFGGSAADDAKTM